MLDFLKRLGIHEVNSGVYSDRWLAGNGGEVTTYSPATGEPIAKVLLADKEEYEQVIVAAQASFLKWREMPAPFRGQVVRELGEVLREYKDELGRLITLEMGKIHQEGLGEVQEIIDIVDFAVGQSRQLYGLTMHSERPGLRIH